VASHKREVSPIFFIEVVTAEYYQELTMQFTTLLKFMNKTSIKCGHNTQRKLNIASDE